MYFLWSSGRIVWTLLHTVKYASRNSYRRLTRIPRGLRALTNVWAKPSANNSRFLILRLYIYVSQFCSWTDLTRTCYALSAIRWNVSGHNWTRLTLRYVYTSQNLQKKENGFTTTERMQIDLSTELSLCDHYVEMRSKHEGLRTIAETASFIMVLIQTQSGPTWLHACPNRFV